MTVFIGNAICGNGYRRFYSEMESEESCSSSDFFYECVESEACACKQPKCPPKQNTNRCFIERRDRRPRKECVQSLKQADLLLKSLYTASGKLVRAIFDSLTEDIKIAVNTEKTLLLTEFTNESLDLEKYIIQILETLLKNLKTGINSIIGSKGPQLIKQVEFHSSMAIAEHTTYYNQLLTLADPALLAIVRDVNNGLLPKTKETILKTGHKNKEAIEKITKDQKAAIDLLLESEIKDAIAAVVKAFKAFVSKYRIYTNAQSDILVKNIMEILGKAEKALISSLDTTFIGNFRFIEFMIRRCIEALSPCGRPSYCSVPPFIFPPALLQNPVIQ